MPKNFLQDPCGPGLICGQQGKEWLMKNCQLCYNFD